MATNTKQPSEAAVLSTKVSAFLKAYANVMDEAHPLTIRVLVYTAKSGRSDILSQLYQGFREPERLSLRQWLSKNNGGKWLKFNRDTNTFAVIKNDDSEAAKAAKAEFIAHEKAYLEGEHFYVKVKGDRNADVFDTTKALARIKTLKAAADKEDSHVSPEMKALMTRMLAEAEIIEAEARLREQRAKLAAANIRDKAKAEGKTDEEIAAMLAAVPAQTQTTQANVGH